MKKRLKEIVGYLDCDMYWKQCNFLDEDSLEKGKVEFYSRDECKNISFRELLLWYLHGIEKSKRDTYIYEGNLLSLRELTKMFIEELNSEYMHCEKDDEIVSFIKNMSLWFGRVYDAVIENKRTLDVDIKTMKICNQLKKDYDNIYNSAETKYVNQETKEWYVHHFSFGKTPKEQQYTSNTVHPITLNITFTGDRKENEISVEKLENMMNKYLKDNGRRFV